MHDCIFTPYCLRPYCDLSCSVHAEISYWMERCNISMDNPVLHSSIESIQYCTSILEENKGKFVVVKCKDTVEFGDLLSYVAICLYGRGTALTHGIYKLNFAEYIEEIKHSWQLKSEPESLEFMRIWANTENYLIINGIDFVKFGDFESQTLLQLIQSRRSPQKCTILVVPERDSLVGNNTSLFFTRLKNLLQEATIK